MDDDKGQNEDSLEAPESGQTNLPSVGNAIDTGRNLKHSADSARRIIGDIRGGASGDGLGKLPGGVSGLGRSGGSVDGISKPDSGGSSNTQSMFRGLESSDPAGRNDTGGDQQNPSASGASRKDKLKKSVGDRAEQFAHDAVKTGKEAKHLAGAIAAGGGNVLDDAEVVKDLANAAAHPIQTAKRYGRVSMYFAGFMAIQFLLVFMIAGTLFFGIYKVYLLTMEAADDPFRTATMALRMESEMTDWLIPAITDLVYERDIAAQKQSGVAVAQTQPNMPELQTNPETSKMFETWDNAGLAAKFLDEYNASFEPSGGSNGGDPTNPGSWDLIVNNQNFGSVNGAKARAFISIFTEETTHWRDIYTREAMQGVASSEFDTQSFLLDLPDSENDINNSRLNTTKQLVTSTSEPISEHSATYYKCLIAGRSHCDSLGLGSTNSDDNSPRDENGNPLAKRLADTILLNTVGVEQIGEYARNTGEQVTPETSSYNTKNTLSANIRTGASDTILASLPKGPDGVSPDTNVLLELYDRYKASIDNENYARVNYDRESRQSIALSENYFIAGGQLVNNEMGILDSWALTENLSIVSQSSLFRTAVMGQPIGVYAQDEADDGNRTCQQIYNDLTPVGDVNQNIDRETTNTSCFMRSLIPDRNTLTQENSVNRIYSILEGQNTAAKQSGSISDVGSSIGAAVGGAISDLQQRYLDQELRTSPLATESIRVQQELSPDFDGYTNNVYGVGRAGPEVDGPAFDSFATSSEALWAKALIDEEVGIGASYQDDEEVARIIRYADNIEREKLAFKPLGERLFAIKDHKSLAGKLAMMTPTNKEDGLKSTIALLKPGNLTSAVASRMTPATFAERTKQVNPLRAVRTNYSLSDPSNTMGGAELWERYNCANGGVVQISSKPEGVPFNLPSNTNPCKREVVMSKVGTCYFDAEDSCSFQDASTGTPGSITDDSSATPCYAGSDDLGVRDDAYTEGRQIRIRLCAINGMTSSSEESQPGGIPNANGRALASSISSEAWVKLVKLAQEQGVPLSASSTFRTMEHQQRLCNANAACRSGSHTAVAEPGHSNHQSGTAMDIAEATGNLSSGASCENPATVGTATYRFLEANARPLGIKHYAKESWHWGTNESC